MSRTSAKFGMFTVCLFSMLDVYKRQVANNPLETLIALGSPILRLDPEYCRR